MIEYNPKPKRRISDMYEDDFCPMTPEQIKIMLINQEQLMRDVQKLQQHSIEIKKYLFAGRVMVATLVFVGLSFDWMIEHYAAIKGWFFVK